MELSEDDQLRSDLIQQLMCQGEIPIHALERRYDIDFDSYFATALQNMQPLVEDGLVRLVVFDPEHQEIVRWIP